MIIQAYFENIKQILIDEIGIATSSIKAAVAWFTDEEIFNKLVKKASEGVRIDLVILDDDLNNSSNIDYELLTVQNGQVWKILESDTKSLMHNKFCIIDQKTIITGSYNWSYKARTNHENITVAKENQELINQFNKEFQHILNHYFPEESIKMKLENVSQTKEIISQTTFKESLLKSERQLLKIQVVGLENELVFIEKSINDFTTIYDIKLGPTLLQLLELKKIIAERLENNDSEQKEAQEQLNNFKESYAHSTKKGWRELTTEQSKELKTIFRQATKLCHPDLVSEAEKSNAESIFNELKILNELNDLEGVKKIYSHLRNGVFAEISIDEESHEIRKLNADVNRLKIKRDTLEKNLLELRESKTYITVVNITNKEEYFQYMLCKIRAEIQEIKEKYAKELASSK